VLDHATQSKRWYAAHVKLRVTRKQIALCLVAGVVTTVVVAWVGVLLGDCLNRIDTVGDDLPKTTRATTALCTETSTWLVPSLDKPPRFGDVNWYEKYIAGLRFRPGGPPDFLFTLEDAGYSFYPRVTWTYLDAGWPFRTVHGWSCVATKEFSTVVKSAREGLIENVPALLPLKGLPHTVSLPYYPLWPGFIANTLIYAALWWLLFTGLVAARRARRVRRGLCTRCAYDLRGVTLGVCPECGQARPK